MAFTNKGMFYLSQKDLQPTSDMIGKGVRGMFGFENKEESIESILKQADYDSVEGRKAAIDQIRQIDPMKADELQKKNQDYETKELGLNKLRNTPALKAEWRLDVSEKRTAYWANDMLAMHGVPEEIAKAAKTPSDITKLINGLVSKGMKSGIASDLKADYKAVMKTERAAYLSSNASTQSKGDLYSSKDTFGGYGANAQADRVDAPDATAPKGFGYEQAPDVTQIDPEATGFGRFWQSEQGKADMGNVISDMMRATQPTTFGALTLNAAEEDLNNRNKPAYAWYARSSMAYFSKNPKDLALAKEDPVGWFETNIAKKKK